jgi:hypothetical protein
MIVYEGTSRQKKSLRKEDPLSTLLFNLVVDMLPLLISRAKEDGQINGLVPHLVEGGLSILQYVNDTILFMENNMEQAKKHETFITCL